MEGWSYWIEKKVYIILKNNRQYSGVVLGIDKDHLILLDKFKERVTFLISEIKIIEEEEEKDNGRRKN